MINLRKLRVVIQVTAASFVVGPAHYRINKYEKAGGNDAKGHNLVELEPRTYAN